MAFATADKVNQVIQKMQKRLNEEEAQLKSDVESFQALLEKALPNESFQVEACETSRRVYIGVCLVSELAQTIRFEGKNVTLTIINQDFNQEILATFKEVLKKVNDNPYRENILDRLSELEKILPKLLHS